MLVSAWALSPEDILNAIGTEEDGATVVHEMTSKWCEDFFDQTFVDFWQTAVGEHTVQECDFLERALLLSKGARLLDIPCGIGQHSLELTRRGYVVTGVDLSSACIAHAQNRSSAEELSVDWRRESMHCIRYYREFDACFCWGNSFGYLEREDTVEFVGAVADALKPGAQFILETGAIAESILPDFKEDTWGRIDDYLALEKHRYDIAAGRLEVQFILIQMEGSRAATTLSACTLARKSFGC